MKEVCRKSLDDFKKYINEKGIKVAPSNVNLCSHRSSSIGLRSNNFLVTEEDT